MNSLADNSSIDQQEIRKGSLKSANVIGTWYNEHKNIDDYKEEGMIYVQVDNNNRNDTMYNNTIKKDTYLIFFVLGFISSRISFFLIEMFNLKVDLGTFMFSLLIFSFLFALGIYTYTPKNFVFTLKTFIFSLLFSIIFSPLIPICIIMGMFVNPLFFLGIPSIFIILFNIGSQYLNEEPLIRFTVKVFIISFTGFFLSIAIFVFMFWASH